MENGNSTLLTNLANLKLGFAGIPTYIFIYVLLFAMCSVVGVFGNLTVILTISMTPTLRQSRNAFIGGLAFADLLISAITMPSSISGVLLGHKFFSSNSPLCMFSSIICSPACVASVYSIASIAISRYYYIGNYSAYVKYFTPRQIIIYIGLIWLFSVLVHLPNHFGWGSAHYSSVFRFCTFDNDLLSYSLFYASTLVLAIVVTFVFYVRIYKTIRRSKLAKNMIVGKEGNHGEGAQTELNRVDRIKNELKMVKASFKIFVLFLVAWSPVSVLILLHMDHAVPPWVYLYTALLAHCNSTFNFIVYFLEDDKFRHGFKKIFEKIKRRNQVANLLQEIPHKTNNQAVSPFTLNL